MTGIVVVSGLPRSGTSLMMQMLSAAGLALQTDGVRSADANNPRGYYEWEAIKQLARNPARIAEAEGKAVKVVSVHLPALPIGFDYKIIFMERILPEIAASQREMIAQLGANAPALPPEQVVRALTLHRSQVDAWIGSRSELRVLRVDYVELVTDAATQSARVAEFLGWGPREAGFMAAQVDPRLRRQGVGTG